MQPGFSVSNSDFCKSLCGECTDMAGVSDVSDVNSIEEHRLGQRLSRRRLDFRETL